MSEERKCSPTTAGVYHVPALLRETVDSLITDPNGIYVDATFGGGGHSRGFPAQRKGIFVYLYTYMNDLYAGGPP